MAASKECSWNILRAFSALNCWLAFISFAPAFVYSKTDSTDVSALNIMYVSMNSPSELDGWKSSGGDPCDDSWEGVSCSGSKVTEIDVSDMGLTGSIGYKLSDLTSVTIFDVSKNKFKGSLPYQLPPNVQRMDLSENEFEGTVPYSISQMDRLKELYLNNNKLNGQLIDMFQKLPKLTDMDLSFNSLSGDLPQSLMNLSSLSTLHLQNNQFTGTLNVLANLPLDDLDVENNKFTGGVPDQLKKIRKIKVGGNSLSSDSGIGQSGKTRMSGPAIVGIILGVLIVLGLIIVLFTRRRSSPPPSHFLEDDRLSQHRPFTPFTSKELYNDYNAESRIDFRDLKSFKSASSFRAKSLRMSPSMRLKPPPSDGLKTFSNNENFNAINTVKTKASVQVSPYSLADLEKATGNFSAGRLLGEGSIGSVYRAKYADGKVVAVKKIDPSLIQGEKDDVAFTEMVSQISKLQHPNISPLIGFCSEQGNMMLVYDYFRNGSIHEYLHLSDDFSKPLTWNTRVRIALGTARAVEYLHEVCSPPSIHKSISTSNILLDSDLNPCLSDCGLAAFRQRRSKNLVDGCIAPECTESSSSAATYTVKSDVYSFGVVMLELMTGRMPFDSRKGKFEQFLVRWASPQLHDIDALGRMADPALHGLYPPKALSGFADIVAQCVQLEAEFRPPISQVVYGLARLVETANYQTVEDPITPHRADDDSDY